MWVCICVHIYIYIYTSTATRTCTPSSRINSWCSVASLGLVLGGGGYTKECLKAQKDYSQGIPRPLKGFRLQDLVRGFRIWVEGPGELL